MTLVFERQLGDEPRAHAFVIGVGGYPNAKSGNPVFPDRDVPDIQSAADSAKFFCDWLLINKDNLIPRLATLEVLISDSQNPIGGYDWQVPVLAGWTTTLVVDTPTFDNVQSAGTAWLRENRVKKGDTVIFYFCGHGSAVGRDPLLLLSDLWATAGKKWRHLDAEGLASSLCQNDRVSRAYLFIDACGEPIEGMAADLAVNSRSGGCDFWDEVSFLKPSQFKALLYCGAPSGLLAYEGGVKGQTYRLGRFTQTLVRALDGALISRFENGWAVDIASSTMQLKKLQEFAFPGWNDQVFEPGPMRSFNEPHHFVRVPNPRVPLVIEPDNRDAVNGHALCIMNTIPPPLDTADEVPFDSVNGTWKAEVQPSTQPKWIIVHRAGAHRSEVFIPDKPHFNLRVSIT